MRVWMSVVFRRSRSCTANVFRGEAFSVSPLPELDLPGELRLVLAIIEGPIVLATESYCALHRRLLWLWPVLVSAGGFCCAAAVKRGSEREPLTPPPRPARPSCCSGPQRTSPKAQTETSSFPTATPKRREVMLGGPPTPVFCKTCPRELTQCAGMPRPMYSVQAARWTALGMALLKHALVPARDLSHALNPSHEASLTCYSWKSSREQIRCPEAEETVYRVWP